MLYAQLEQFDEIQSKRKAVWEHYYKLLKPFADSGNISIPDLPDYATRNGNMFFLVTRNPEERLAMLDFLGKKGVYAVFHYLPLHSSDFFEDKHDGRALTNTDHFSECVIRLPFYNEMSDDEIDHVVTSIEKFFM